MNNRIASLERKLKNNFSIIAFVFMPIVILISTELSVKLISFPVVNDINDSYIKQVIGYILLGFFSLILIANLVILVKQLLDLKRLNKNITKKDFNSQKLINKWLYVFIIFLTGIIGGQNILSKNYVRFGMFAVLSLGGIGIYKNILNILTLVIVSISIVDLLVVFTKKSNSGKIILVTKGVNYEW